MMRHLPVIYREGALSDIEQIIRYLREQGASAQTVHGFVARIEDQCERIGNLPEGYPARPDLGPGIRIAPFERSATIAYRIESAAVHIVNVFYGGRDYETALRTDS